jgi:prevent-host-death family protein
MKTISKSKLKARMLEYFRSVEETGEELVVTSHGKPVLKVVPIEQKLGPEVLFAAERGHVTYGEDPVADTAGEWPEK